jgi:alpha-N-arabinofuranosidase
MIRRREFVRNSAFGAAALLLARPARLASAVASSAPDARVEVLPNEVLGTISPNIYGHFIEHVGGVIYDGVWVGENSKVQNIDGIRKDLVDEMRKIKAPVVRYPGGCFADT